jgi:MarR family transcriptional regulator, organic hydroperoxide resistance regulator
MAKKVDGRGMVSDEVVGAVSALIRAEHRHAAHLAQAMALPLTDSLALFHLANEPLPARTLGDRLGLTSGSVTALVDRLIGRELVRRIPHESDRRVVLVEMTSTGHEVSWAAIHPFVFSVMSLTSELGESDKATIAAFVRRLVEAIEADTERLQASS